MEKQAVITGGDLDTVIRAATDLERRLVRAKKEIEKLRKERILFHRVVKRAYEESKDLRPCPFCRRDPHEIYCLVTQLGKMMTWAGEPQDEDGGSGDASGN